MALINGGGALRGPDVRHGNFCVVAAFASPSAVASGSLVMTAASLGHFHVATPADRTWETAGKLSNYGGRDFSSHTSSKGAFITAWRGEEKFVGVEGSSEFGIN